MRILTMLLLATLALGLAGCQSGGGAEASEDAYEIAVVPKSVSFDFWATVHEGARAAAEELGTVEVIWKGPSSETAIARQISIVESFITQGVDALVIAPADAHGLVPVLRRAKAAGLTVVTIDSSTEPQVSVAHIATDNVRAAAKAAALLAEVLGEEGQVALIPYIAGASTSNARERGFKEALQQYPGLQLVAVQYSNSDYGQAMAVTENILTAHPGLDGLFAANEPSVLGAVQAVEAHGRLGEVAIVGFDASPRELEGVREGAISGLVVQDPFKMGYLGVKQAVKALEGEEVAKRTGSGSTVVTQKNLEAFLAQRTSRRSGAAPSTVPVDTTAADTTAAGAEH